MTPADDRSDHLTMEPELHAFLEFLRDTRGFDFTGYKPGTLTRRVGKRMGEIGVGSYAEYREYLELHPDEWAALFDTILINVTSFFRDPGAWTFLEQEIIPKILDTSSPDEAIRVWSAGCASGEEAYSLAVLFAEAMGPDEFYRRVKIYGTDVDRQALDQARRAVYTRDQLEPVPDRLRAEYFTPVDDDQSEFRASLRRSVIFGSNDITRDAPISRLDLLACRNALMYLTAETQTHVLRRFHFALKDTGYLFLGRAEMLFTRADLFASVGSSQRVFTKVPARNLRPPPKPAVTRPPESGDAVSAMRIRAFEMSPAPTILVDLDQILVAANRRARTELALLDGDLGRPLRDLDVSFSFRPTELRGAVEEALATGRPVVLDSVAPRGPSGGETAYEVHVAPVHAGDGTHLGASVTFADVTEREALGRELRRTREERDAHAEELHSTNEELETTNEELHSTNEELETTNEELQSTNEELETTNEELQASNEELETMNEELQATNDQVEAMNVELRARQGELQIAHEFTEAVLTSLSAVVIVLDPSLTVQRWNSAAEDLWGLASDRVQGRSILALDIGLSVEALREPLRHCLDEGKYQETLVRGAADRRGQTFDCRVICTPLSPRGEVPRGVVVLMEPQ